MRRIKGGNGIGFFVLEGYDITNDMVMKEKKSYLKLDFLIKRTLKLVNCMLPFICLVFSHFSLVVDVYNYFLE